jgi:glycosyltransferase involved in cell wall biosynthesis
MEHAAHLSDAFRRAYGRAPRILFLDGPGNTALAFRRWRAGADHPGETAVTYSSQVFGVAERLGAKLLALSSATPTERVEDGDFVVEHRARPWPSATGPAFGAAQTLWAIDLMRVARRFRPDVMLISESPHPFLFAPLKAAGVRLICALHCTLWPAGFPPTSPFALQVARANGWFFREICDVTLAISPECERQVASLAGSTRGPLLPYRPKYRAHIAAPRETAGRPLRVLFAGRCEREKGVFDALELARRLARKRPGEFHFAICGGGSSQRDVEVQIRIAGLVGSVRALGQLGCEELRAEYERCDVVLVPTTADFPEGLNKVALEALLAGRPAILSTTIPAGELVGDAALVVPAGDLDGFQAALERLADDPVLYRRCSAATIPAAAAFVGTRITFEAVVEQALRAQLDDLAQSGRTEAS